MEIQIPVGIVFSRAAMESAWRKSQAEGRTVRGEDLGLRYETQDAADLPPAAQKRFARFVLQTMRQDAAEPEKEVVTA